MGIFRKIFKGKKKSSNDRIQDNTLKSQPQEKKNPHILLRNKYKSDRIICFKTDKNKWGITFLLDSNQEKTIPAIYASAYYDELADALIAFQYKKDIFKLGKQLYHIFSTSGERLAEFKDIDFITKSKNQLLLSQNGKKGLLNKKFELVIPCEYQSLTAISDTVFAAQKFDVQLRPYQESNHSFNGIIDYQNKILGSFDFSIDVFDQIHENSLIVGNKHDCHYSYNLETKKQEKLEFDQVFNEFEDHFGGEAFFRSIRDVDYDGVHFIEGLFGTDFDEYLIGKWGVIRPDGSVVIPNEYDYLERLNDKLYKFAIGIPQTTHDEQNDITILKGFKWGVIDLKNNSILKAEFDWIDFDLDQNEIMAIKGCIVKWYGNEHKPQWVFEGGEIHKTQI